MDFESFKKKCCAGVVTYNPDISLLKKNLDLLQFQVDSIVIVDNASKNIHEIKKVVSSYRDIKIIQNCKNLGIAKALNQVLMFAYENKYEWYLSMDQDSCCDSNMVSEYSKFVDEDKTVAIFCPFILNNNKISLNDYKKFKLETIEKITDPCECITSGSLNRVSYSKAIGGYTDKLFIDCVDFDFNMRQLLANNSIFKVNTTYMVQSMGQAKSVCIMQLMYKITKLKIFRQLRYSSVYSDLRLYYISRNSHYMQLKYGKNIGRRNSTFWLIFQFAYYLLTYPVNRSRRLMLKNIKQGWNDSKDLI